jgi:ABC-type transport system involved in multi-copper enzyme maturation permease subunit
MHKILAIARNTFRENVRDRILYNLVLFAFVMILSAVALGQLALGQERKVIVDLGLSSISIFGVLIAIFIGISLVYKEIEKRTVYALLAKPIHRRDLILGKYLGLLFTLLVNVAVMAAGLMLTLLYFGETGIQAYLRLLPAVYLIFLSLMVTTALALLFSTFSTPALSALFTLFLWVIGHFNRDLLGIGKLTESAIMERLGGMLYYLLPNFSNFEIIGSQNIIQSVAYSKPIDPIAIGWITIYGLIYSSLLLALSVAIFSRRDFK